jgi:hypothetical protein
MRVQLVSYEYQRPGMTRIALISSHRAENERKALRALTPDDDRGQRGGERNREQRPRRSADDELIFRHGRART